MGHWEMKRLEFRTWEIALDTITSSAEWEPFGISDGGIWAKRYVTESSPVSDRARYLIDGYFEHLGAGS